MLEEIKNVIKESSLSPEVKQYVISLVFQDIANKQYQSIMSDLDSPKKEQPSNEADKNDSPSL